MRWEMKMNEEKAAFRIDHTVQKRGGTVRLALLVEVTGDDNMEDVDEYKEFLDRKMKGVVEDFTEEWELSG
jgi:hypothetical protein